MLDRIGQRCLWLLLAACAVPCMMAGTALAQEAGEATAEKGMTMIDIIMAGGIVEAVIILVSIIATTLIIDYFWNVRPAKLMPQAVVRETRDLMKERAYNDVLRLCNEKKCFFTDVLSSGLLKLRHDFAAVQEAVLDAIDKGNAKLQAKISYLSFIGTMAPMLGLLGTVTGMIRSFANIAKAAALNKPELLAKGVSEALITTATGLIVAIPVMFFYFFFRGRVNRIVLDVETTVTDMLEPFRPVRKA